MSKYIIIIIMLYTLFIYVCMYVCVTVPTAGRDEEHADEDVLQNNSL